MMQSLFPHRSKLRADSAEQSAGRVFRLLVVLAVLLFAAFYLVGYDTPYDIDPNFNAPMLTDTLIVSMVVLLLAAIVAAMLSIVREMRTRSDESKIQNGVPALLLSRIVMWGTLLSIVITFLAGSSEPMRVGGSTYNEWLWLKVADMFIYTTALLMIAAFVAVVYGLTRYRRTDKHLK